MNIFLHICCAPCALYPYFRLKEEGFSPTGFFYNPNIHPYLEYKKRLDTVREFSSRVGVRSITGTATTSIHSSSASRAKAPRGVSIAIE